MSFTITAPIIHIGKTEQVSDKFKKRDLVVRIDGRYPQEPKFQVTQDRCDLLDSLNAGDHVKIHFDLNGRAYEKDGVQMWFTTLDAWKIEVLGRSSTKESAQQAVNYVEKFEQADAMNDDVPF